MSVRAPSAVWRRSNVDLFLATVGVVVAVVWFVGIKRLGNEERTAAAEERLTRGAGLIGHYQALEAKRLVAAAEMLATDQRLRSTLLSGLDEPTLVDSFKDIEALDHNSLHAVLSPSGKVAAVVGDETLRKADLSSSSLVKAAQNSEHGVTSHWLLDGKLVEVAAASSSLGNEVKGIVLVGDTVSDAALSELAAAADITIGVVGEGNVLSSSKVSTADIAALADIVSKGQSSTHLHRTIEVNTALPPAKLVVLTPLPKTTQVDMLQFVPLLGALVFAILAVLRSGR